MSVRLHFVVEGQTEETFVNRVLAPHLATYSVWGKVRCVMTSRRRGVIHRGGLLSYAMARKDIRLWMKEDQNADAVFTTMFDLYRLPSDSPGYDQARRIGDPRRRVTALEEAMREDIGDRRLIPYLQLHEFEALLLADPQKLQCEFLDRDAAVQNLVVLSSRFDSPEMIDDGEHTAPSKRIIQEIPEYQGMKASAGPLVAEKIGLACLREKCKHFGEWLSRLESMGGRL
ncbi:MAG: DUF4276 family protein [Planctomycetes bacterium]|nr:DUF4276 family protein [Planctomycetota bacterium]MBM4086108.1 DUF4276 family protein [Planctomycetota bacterium]